MGGGGGSDDMRLDLGGPLTFACFSGEERTEGETSHFQFFPLESSKGMPLAPQDLDMVSKYQGEAGFIKWLLPGLGLSPDRFIQEKQGSR